MKHLKLNLFLALSACLLLTLCWTEPLGPVPPSSSLGALRRRLLHDYLCSRFRRLLFLARYPPGLRRSIRPADRSACIPDALPTCKVLGFYALTRVKVFRAS